MQFLRQRLQCLGRRCFVDEMETAASGFGHGRVDAIHQHPRLGCLVTRDVVQRHVAEAALLPVTPLRHRQLVPACFRPKPVHGVEHVQHRKIAIQRQSVPGRRSGIGESDIALAALTSNDEAHQAVFAQEGARQLRALALALLPFDDAQQRPLARIQRHEIKIVEHLRLGQFAQLGIDESATEHGHDARIVCLDRLRNAKGAIDRTGERHRQRHDLRLMARDGRQAQLDQGLVNEVARRGQRPLQRRKAWLALRQRLGVTDKLEALIHGIAPHIGQIVEIQRRQVTRPILAAQRAERPTERIATAIVFIRIECGKARPFRQEVAPDDPMRQAGIATLQEGNGHIDRAEVALKLA